MSIESPEIALISALFYSETLVAQVSSVLDKQHFADPWIGDKTMALIDVLHNGGTSQAFLLSQAADVRKSLMAMMMAGLGVGYALIVPELCEAILEQWRLRRLREIGFELASLQDSGKSMDVIGSMQVELEGMCEPERKTRFTEREVTERIFHATRESLPAQPTGILKLDQAMGGGMYAGKAYGFIARKKMGKTILGCTISHNIQQKHLFICCEMGASEVHERVLARRMQVFPSAFRTEYRKTPSFQSSLAECVVTSGEHAIYADAAGITLDGLKRLLTTEVMKSKIQGFILDYWQLVGGQRRGSNEREHLDEVAQWIATFCRKHKVWAFVLGQENQDGNTRGGEGMRLAFDQVYRLRRMGDDPSNPYAHLEMMETRYTPWLNVGDETSPGLLMQEKGPYFEQC